MTPRQQQARRKELHKLTQRQLRALYAAKSGHLVSEVEAMVKGLSDDGRQLLIDGIIRIESGR